MSKNEGTIDRVIRGVGGTLLAYFSYVSLSGFVQIVGFVISAVLLFTAFTGFCLLYKLFGFSTNKK